MPVMPGAAIQGAKITGPSNERVDMFRLQVCYIISCEIPKLLRLKSTFFCLNDGKCHVFLAGEIQRFVPGPASHLCGAEKTARSPPGAGAGTRHRALGVHERNGVDVSYEENTLQDGAPKL